ncbi:MAG: hypothetical protein EOP51_18685 [Sphingobacteriales bacterium]|nr:MAG: hypothetical protein EOP51_18685 [Sphingobacteriales bacterium]
MKNTIQLLAMALLIVGLGSCKKSGSDEKASPTLKTFTISGRASSSLNDYIENNGVTAFINLTEGMSYSFNGARANPSKTDLVLRTSYYGGGVPTSSRDLFVSSVKSGKSWAGNEDLYNLSIRLDCKLALAQDVDFEAIKTNKKLQEAYNKILPENLYSSSNFMDTPNLTLIFSTEAGKLGLLHLVNYSANKPFGFVIKVKIMK